MAADRGPGTELRDQTAINVAGLLKQPIGGTRVYRLRLDRFPLDDELVASDVRGEVKLTRLRDAIIANVRVAAAVALECARCLRIYDQAVIAEFSEEYRQTVDVRTGVGMDAAGDDDETSTIDENHELDLTDVLRQEIVVALPMRPDCGELCPGPDALTSEDGDADPGLPGDERLAALAALLGDDDVATDQPGSIR